MANPWQQSIRASRDIVAGNRGPEIVAVVTGRGPARAFWEARLPRVKRRVFRRDGRTAFHVIEEETKRGNFLGTLQAWRRLRDAHPGELPPAVLISMTFGQGKRISPFTQVLGNRKSAFPTPFRLDAEGGYLNTGDLSNLYTNAWIDHLVRSGFRGVVVKWGDEAVIPGVPWQAGARDLSGLDAMRFAWQTEPTEALAREKDWMLLDPETGRMLRQYSRQPRERLAERVEATAAPGQRLAVNLGSLGVSYRFLDEAVQVFGEDLEDPARWADWDPYVWMALAMRSPEAWSEERELEARQGRAGLRELEATIPDFFPKIARLRERLDRAAGGELAIGVLDFGEPLWIDFGLHAALRRCLGRLRERGAEADAIRDCFGVPDARDGAGNLLVGSRLPPDLHLANSVVIDSEIRDASSVIRDAVIVGSRIGRAEIREGGAVLFSAANSVQFEGPDAVLFRSVAPEVTLPAGGRQASLVLPDYRTELSTLESVTDYSGDTYETPVLGNAISFREAGARSERVDPAELERAWDRAWRELVG